MLRLETLNSTRAGAKCNSPIFALGIRPVLFQNQSEFSQTILADAVFRLSSGRTEFMDTAVQMRLDGAGRWQLMFWHVLCFCSGSFIHCIACRLHYVNSSNQQALLCFALGSWLCFGRFYPGPGVPDNARAVYTEMFRLFSSSCLFASISLRTASTAKVVEAVSI